MISTRVMDFKLREAAEGLGEDSAGKKKSKFKTFKKLFGKKKRKDPPSSSGGSTWKQSQAKSEVIAIEAGPVGYDSEDELEEARGALGGRALSHDSIFIPESGPDPARPVRVFSQENVCDRIKALQLKIQCHVNMGPPPPGGLPAKRGEDPGMSSEDDGLPRSPPELSLLPEAGPGTAVKVSLASSSRPPSPDQPSSGPPGDALAGPRTAASSGAPVADFSCPPESSSCLDNSAAKHKLLVKPRNQRSSKMRRLSSRAQSESLGDLTCTPEEEEEETPGAERQAEPRGPAPVLPPGGPRARRARLQHCPALSASAEEVESPPGRQATPEVMEVTEVAEPVPGPAPCLECPLLPEDSPHPDPGGRHHRQEPSLESPRPCSEDAAGDAGSSSPHVPEEDTAPPGTCPATPVEAPPGPGGPGHGGQEGAGLTLAVPGPEGAEGTECSEDLAPRPPASRSCLKHQAPARSLSVSPRPPASPPQEPAPQSPPQEPAPCALDKEAAPPKAPSTEQGESPQPGAEPEAPEQKLGRGGGRPRGGRKFSVSSGRAWPHAGHRERPARPGPLAPAAPAAARLPLARSRPAWRSEAALDDPPAPPERPNAAGHGPQDSGGRGAGPARPRQRPPEAAATPATGEPRPAAQEPPPSADRSPFPVKLRATSLSFRHRDVPAPEGKAAKRYSAEVRLEKGGLALLIKDDKCHAGAPPTIRGARSPSGQGQGKAQASEQAGFKPPLPRKPLLQALTLPCPPAGPARSPGEPAPGPRKESRPAEKRPPRRGAEKGLPPAAPGPGAEGQSGPPWITITPQKRRGAPEQPPNQEDKPGAQTLEPEIGKPAKAPERAQGPARQADFIRSKSFLITPAKPADRRQGSKLCLQEGLQRGISLSHQNLAAQAAAMAERELHQLKRASYASAEQPSWMELARKKAQAWSDMPQIIK
ncbi:CRACD-like protein [Pipistrellus kuhlii]|uniref:CRACD-like protein n=1 Tax=Pipistrellus kuhlii TaxID=59472 RepID=UPI00174F4D9C|nr:CRACD-like protein [Pipistrellus kuhlii]